MTKQEKLDKLDGLLADKMLEIMETGEYAILSDLATVSNYLAKNNRILEKERSTVEYEIKEKLKKAKANREQV